MQRYYGIPLADLAGGRLTWRRLHVLVSRLPVESAYMQEVHGEAVWWTPTEHLLATVIDTLRYAHFKRPKPIVRPGQRPKPIGKSSRPTHEVRAYLDSFKPKAGD